jgi:hypothetical protein
MPFFKHWLALVEEDFHNRRNCTITMSWMSWIFKAKFIETSPPVAVFFAILGFFK